MVSKQPGRAGFRALLWAPLEVLDYFTQFPVTPPFEFYALSQEKQWTCVFGAWGQQLQVGC